MLDGVWHNIMILMQTILYRSISDVEDDYRARCHNSEAMHVGIYIYIYVLRCVLQDAWSISDSVLHYFDVSIF